jgi:hypothetical protein
MACTHVLPFTHVSSVRDTGASVVDAESSRIDLIGSLEDSISTPIHSPATF